MLSASDKDKQITRLQAQVDNQSALIEQLKEALILERQRRFAKLNEGLRSLQSELFDEVEAEAQAVELATKSEQVTIPAHTRKKTGGRKPLPKDLPLSLIHI